jgi:PAS domain S-box-containing protein
VAEGVSQVNSNSHPVADPRVREALNVIFEFALGNLKARGTISEQNDDMDALITGINMLGEELEAYIAESKKAEEQLRTSEEKFRSLVETTSDWVWELDENGVLTYVSPRVADILGYEVKEMLGKTPFDYMPPEEARRVAPIFSNIIAAQKEFSLLEIVNIHRDGRLIYLETSGTPFFGKDGNLRGYRGMNRDITERKNAEEQLRNVREELVRKEKLAVLGELSGSVGHELRNPLSVINNAVYFLKTVTPDAGETVREYLDMIKSEVGSAERIISDLLDFSRTKTPQRVPVGALQLIHQSLGKCYIPGSVQVKLDVPETLPEALVDPFQMVQVFQNLITNAVQAMPEGGELRITARLSTLAAAGLAPAGMRKGQPQDLPLHEQGTFNGEPTRDFIEISVADTGGGISPEDMKKLFQPLFTTKARGIGLGLVVSKKLAEANGGRIGVASEVGKGTTFTVMLPVREL